MLKSADLGSAGPWLGWLGWLGPQNASECISFVVECIRMLQGRRGTTVVEVVGLNISIIVIAQA